MVDSRTRLIDGLVFRQRSYQKIAIARLEVVRMFRQLFRSLQK